MGCSYSPYPHRETESLPEALNFTILALFEFLFSWVYVPCTWKYDLRLLRRSACRKKNDDLVSRAE
jgi:hypothetical protein